MDDPRDKPVSDPEHTATLPADGASAPATTREPAPVREDLESAAHDHRELPVVDPDTYVFGHYFARGGMGRIAAVRDKRLGRVIAIKELITRDPGLVARFRREIRITAQLQHPAIVSVLEAGQWANGEPFFAMKKVAGGSLKEAIEARPQLDERLGLVASVIAIVDALAYAHDRGIIHRDLKPANVLVGEFGETVVIDWGLAKDLRAADDGEDPMPSLVRTADAHETAAGSILGTPAFMAPEQARGEEADARTDVYALGAILYTVLAGKPPYHGADPKVILARVVDGAPVPVGTLEAGIPVDLQAIVTRAMARDPASRYPSAKELAADLKRFQTGQLVAAHHYTRAQLFRRWVRRHRGALVVAIAALVAVTVLGAESLRRIVRERDRARSAEREASSRADALVLAGARASVASDPMRALRSLGELPLSSSQWPAARLVAADAVMRGVPRTFAETFGAAKVDVSRDGRLVAIVQGDKQLGVIDVGTGARRELGMHDGNINYVRFTPDGTSLLTASHDNTVGIWPVAGGAPRKLRGHTGFVFAAALSPSGTHLVSSALDRTTRVWTLSGEELAVVPVMLREGGISRDARWIVGYDADQGSAIWEVATGRQTLALGISCAGFMPAADVVVLARERKLISRELVTGVETELGELEDLCASIAVSHDGRKLVVGTLHGVLEVWDIASRKRGKYRGLKQPIIGVQWRADDAWIAAWGQSTEAHLIDPSSHEGRALAGSRGQVVFVPGDRVVAFDADQRLLAWPTTPGGTRVYPVSEATRTAAASPDGTRVAAGGTGWSLRITQLATGETRDLPGHEAPVVDVAWSPNGALLASLCRAHRVRLWDVRAGNSVELPGRGSSNLAFAPDGEHVAAVGDDRRIAVWSVATGAVRQLAGHDAHVLALAFSPDGRSLVSASGDRTLRLWDPRTGQGRVVGTHEAAIRVVRFSPDGTSVAAGDEAGVVAIWPLAGGPPRRLTGHGEWIVDVTFDHAGRRLASVGTDKSVRVWDLATGAGRLLGSHDDEVLAAAFAPEERVLATADSDGEVRLWDLVTGDHRVLAGHTEWIRGLRWLGDARLMTVGSDRSIRVWTDDLPRDPGALREWLRAAR